MKIYIASDHKGYKLKEKIKEWLENQGYHYGDMGPYELDENDDYPDFIKKVGEKVSENPEDKGIVLGLTGEGESMLANKYKGVRSALYTGGDLEVVRLSRYHNNSNILSLGAGFLSEKEAIEALKTWLETDFSEDERHKRRINKIKEIEENL